jgi:hypothetical protein
MYSHHQVYALLSRNGKYACWEKYNVVEVVTYVEKAGRDRVVGIATHHILDGPGIKARWGRDFPQPFRPVVDPTGSVFRCEVVGAWCLPPAPI